MKKNQNLIPSIEMADDEKIRFEKEEGAEFIRRKIKLAMFKSASLRIRKTFFFSSGGTTYRQFPLVWFLLSCPLYAASLTMDQDRAQFENTSVGRDSSDLYK